ncbi:MAG: hypothetical protein CV089_04970 [Nitrospira sp. WS110]|nr:hypothetical protein [Nitrospira sp. WS110]
MVEGIQRRTYSSVWRAVFVGSLLLTQEQSGMAKDLLAPKEQEITEIGSTASPSFDDQEKGVPQSLFTWIKMAKGFDVEWDTFGRKGWYTQDPRLKPIDPGSVFTPEIPAIYIVFEVAPLEDPAQFAVQWYLEQSRGQASENPLGKDVLEVPGHERYGYLELKRSGARWEVGNYLAKIYITPLGQQPFHAVNQVGTMRFTVGELVPALPSGQSSVK